MEKMFQTTNQRFFSRVSYFDHVWTILLHIEKLCTAIGLSPANKNSKHVLGEPSQGQSIFALWIYLTTLKRWDVGRFRATAAQSFKKVYPPVN